MQNTREMLQNFSIQTLEIIAGSLPSRAKSLVVEWAQLHKAELIANWQKASVPEPLQIIEPLQ